MGCAPPLASSNRLPLPPVSSEMVPEPIRSPGRRLQPPLVPRTDTAHERLGTILPQEGGPGYSTTGSGDFYSSLFDALRDRRDVLIDKRGTGFSDPIDCPAMQTGSTALSAVAACAAQLGDTAWYYGTDYAAANIIAVLDALEIDEVDFYGDSYGTFVGQVLAGVYPNRLRSIILDSAYPVRPPDPWFGTDWAAAWSGIDLSCGRSPSCSSLGGTATLRVHKVINDIRAKPITGKAPDGNGVLRPTTVDTSSLINIVDDAGFGPPIYRDLDAATRAWTDSKDSLPLRRLVAEQYTPAVYRPIDCSYGLYNDVTCSDYPLLYEMNATRAARDGQYTSALEEARQNRPALFAPFTVDEGIESQVYITPLDQCLPWRAPPEDLAPGSAGAPLPPSVHRRRPERRSRLQCNHAQAARLARRDEHARRQNDIFLFGHHLRDGCGRIRVLLRLRCREQSAERDAGVDSGRGRRRLDGRAGSGRGPGRGICIS
jgi:pimeloyl-ACP methyl ester carboxylesterase